MADADEDLFADLYEDEVPAKPNSVPAPAKAEVAEPSKEEAPPPVADPEYNVADAPDTQYDAGGAAGDIDMHGSGYNGQGYNQEEVDNDDNYGPINVKEDG